MPKLEKNVNVHLRHQRRANKFADNLITSELGQTLKLTDLYTASRSLLNQRELPGIKFSGSKAAVTPLIRKEFNVALRKELPGVDGLLKAAVVKIDVANGGCVESRGRDTGNNHWATGQIGQGEKKLAIAELDSARIGDEGNRNSHGAVGAACNSRRPRKRAGPPILHGSPGRDQPKMKLF